MRHLGHEEWLGARASSGGLGSRAGLRRDVPLLRLRERSTPSAMGSTRSARATLRGCRPISPSCSSRRTAGSRLAVKARSARSYGSRASAPTRPGRGCGVNAIHGAAAVLQRLADYESRRVTHRRVWTTAKASPRWGSEAGWPATSSQTSARSMLTTGSRRTRNPAEAEAHLRSLFAGYPVEIVDAVAGAPPGPDARPRAQDFYRGRWLGADREAGLDRCCPLCEPRRAGAQLRPR